MNDFVGSVIRSEYYAELSGLNLYDNPCMKKNARQSILTLKEYVWNLFSPKDTDISDFREFFISTLEPLGNNRPISLQAGTQRSPKSK